MRTHMPLEADESYPREWPAIRSLGETCEGIDGVYRNQGRVTMRRQPPEPLRLTAALGIDADAERVALDFRPDRSGSAARAELAVALADGSSKQWPLRCLCHAQTLLCAEVERSSWSLGTVGFGAGQTNVYLATGTDGSLVLRLQAYSAGMVVLVPLYSKTEAWARFEAVPHHFRGAHPNAERSESEAGTRPRSDEL